MRPRLFAAVLMMVLLAVSVGSGLSAAFGGPGPYLVTLLIYGLFLYQLARRENRLSFDRTGVRLRDYHRPGFERETPRWVNALIIAALVTMIAGPWVWFRIRGY